MACLHKVLEKRVLLELESIARVHVLERGHELLDEGLPGIALIVDVGGRGEHEAARSRVFQGLVEGVDVVLLGEGDDGYAGLGGAHLSDQDLGRVLLVHPEDELVADSVARLDESVGEGRGVAIELAQRPVEVLLVKAHRVEHVIAGDCDLILPGDGVSGELRVEQGLATVDCLCES